MDTACCSEMQVCLIYCVVRARFDTSSKREATSRIVNLFHELFQVVNSIAAKYFRFVSRTLRLKFLVLLHAPSYIRRYDHIVLNCLSIVSVLRLS